MSGNVFLEVSALHCTSSPSFENLINTGRCFVTTQHYTSPVSHCSVLTYPRSRLVGWWQGAARSSFNRGNISWEKAEKASWCLVCFRGRNVTARSSASFTFLRNTEEPFFTNAVSMRLPSLHISFLSERNEISSFLLSPLDTGWSLTLGSWSRN